MLRVSREALERRRFLVGLRITCDFRVLAVVELILRSFSGDPPLI